MAAPLPQNPQVVICMSGKRKSGKDYIAQAIVDRLRDPLPGIDTVKISVAGPIKKLYALKYGLDYEQLLGTSGYKEQVRRGMVDFSDEIRVQQDLDYFIKYSIQENDPTGRVPVWILTDARRSEDMDFFVRSHYACSVRRLIKIRVNASLESRVQRGFQFTAGIDDYHTECALDDYPHWDYVIQNDSSTAPKEMAAILDSIVNLIQSSVVV